MLRFRRLIPLLTAVLVIQSLVAALPHAHGQTVDGQAWRAAASIDSAHHCLACSVHAPVVEPTVEAGGAAGLATIIPASVDLDSSNVFSIDSTSSPRGPPRIV